jgi:hypothetical protein
MVSQQQIQMSARISAALGASWQTRMTVQAQPRRTATAAGINRRATQVLALQQALGNQAVQAKLAVSKPGGRYEEEADRIADQVMQLPAPAVRRQAVPERESGEGSLRMTPFTAQITPLVQRQTPTEEEDGQDKEEMLQANGTAVHSPAIAPSTESGIESMRQDGGQPLDLATRALMEPRFGYDFGQVRIHTGPQASAAARAVNARAFTLGRHVFFGDGGFRPTTLAGQALIAHELVHTVQQDAGTPWQVQRAPATGALPSGVLPQTCFDGMFAPQPSPALPAFESGQALAIRWVRTARTRLKKVHDGTARPAEAALVHQTFSARFGEPDIFAGMKKVSHVGVAQPRVAQTAQGVVLDLVNEVAQALPQLRPAGFLGPGLPAPGSPVGLDLEGRRAAAQRAEVVTAGITVFCGRTPAVESCPATAAAFFSAQDNAIGVCDGFFSQQPRGRATILIHELVHALVQPGVNDVYTHSRLFSVLQAAPGPLGRPGGFALRNPDSIAEFIRVLAEVTTTGSATTGSVPGAPSDAVEGFGENETDVRLALGFAHQRALLAQTALTDLLAGLHEVRTIIVGRSGSSSAMTWGSERDQFFGCRIQRVFEDADSRVTGLGDPCSGGTHIGPDGVAFLRELGTKYDAITQAFSSPLVVRYQPEAGVDVPILWVPGTTASLLVDDFFFALDPPARARAIILGMQKRSIAVPTGIDGAPPIMAQAGVVDNVVPADVDLMDRFLADVLPVFAGPGG